MGLRDWLGFASGAKPLTAAVSTAVAVAPNHQMGGAGRSSSEVWTIWRRIGEIHYATTQQARLISRIRWDIEIDGERAEPEAAEALLTAGFGDRLPELARLAAIHLQVAGGYYLARFEADWEVLPYPKSNAGGGRKIEDADVVIPVVNPDPLDPKLTDSPVMAALDVARELLLARTQARIASRNRTAQLQTVLYPLEGAGPDTEQFEKDLVDVITAPIEDEHSSSVVVPNIIGFQSDHIDKWRTIDLTGPIDEKLADRIERLIRQLAVMLDIPPELLTGMGDTNHWSQWAIQEDNWLGHVEPMAKILGRGFAEALARAANLDLGRVAIVPDPSPLLQRRPTVSDALTAFGAGLVSGDWTREQLGADVDDAVVEENSVDPVVQQALDLARGAPSLVQNPGLPALVAQLREVISNGPTAPVPGEVETTADQVEDLTPAIETVAEPATASMLRALNASAPPFSTERLLSIDRQAADSVDDLLAMAMERVVQRVGSQIRSRLQGDAEARARLAGLTNAELVAEVGVDGLPALDQTVADTVTAVVTEPFHRIVNRAYADTRAAGVLVRQDQERTADAVAVLQDDAAEIALLELQGEATTGYLWALNQRVLTIAGGGNDPAPEPEVAAPRRRIPMPDPLDTAGIALGRGAVQWVIDNVGVTPRAYQWEHVGGSGNDHPEHVGFDGIEFDGESYEYEGIIWFPGDHTGCRCRRVPLWEDVAA